MHTCSCHSLRTLRWVRVVCVRVKSCALATGFSYTERWHSIRYRRCLSDIASCSLSLCMLAVVHEDGINRDSRKPSLVVHRYLDNINKNDDSGSVCPWPWSIIRPINQDQPGIDRPERATSPEWARDQHDALFGGVIDCMAPPGEWWRTKRDEEIENRDDSLFEPCFAIIIIIIF